MLWVFKHSFLEVPGRKELGSSSTIRKMEMLIPTRLWPILSEGCYSTSTTGAQVNLRSTAQRNLRKLLKTTTLSISNALCPWTGDLCWETRDWKLTLTFLLLVSQSRDQSSKENRSPCITSMQCMCDSCPSQQLSLSWHDPHPPSNKGLGVQLCWRSNTRHRKTKPSIRH